MKKILTVTTIILLAVTTVVGRRLLCRQNTARTTVGILQTASHPALDDVQTGFVQELQNNLGNNVAFVTHNAQGSIMQAHAIAQQLHADPAISAVFAIGTPAAQAVSAVEKSKPIIIAAVTDPDALGLTREHNICGVSDMIDISKEIKMLTELVPQAKTIGLLYTSGEPNALASVHEMRNEVASHGLTTVDFAIGSEADMPAMVELACRKTDLILAPTDNIVASTVPLITAITKAYNKPFIASHNGAVAQGALASRGIDYNMLGHHAARIALRVLVEGKKPFELPIEYEENEKIYINQDALHTLNLTIPASWEKNIILITQGV